MTINPQAALRTAATRLGEQLEGVFGQETPTVFPCVHNAGRSQMALGFFQHLADEQAVAWSGARSPAMSSTRQRWSR